jgi:hypothetical protein
MRSALAIPTNHASYGPHNGIWSTDGIIFKARIAARANRVWVSMDYAMRKHGRISINERDLPDAGRCYGFNLYFIAIEDRREHASPVCAKANGYSLFQQGSG